MRRWIALLLAVLLGSTILVGCSEKDRTVLEIEGHEIPYSEYEIYFNNEKLKISDAVGRPYEEVKDIRLDEDGNTYESIAAANAQSALVFNKICEFMFEELGLSYTAELENQTERLFQQQAEANGGEETYLKKLKEVGLDEEKEKRYLKASILNTAVKNAIYGPEGENPVTEQEIANEFRYNYYLIQPLMISKFENNTMLTGPQLQEKEKKYEQAKAALSAGEEFTTVLKEYGELELSEQDCERGILIGSRISGYDEYKAVLQSAESQEPGQIVYGETDSAFYAIHWLPIDETVQEWGAEQVRIELEELKFQQYMEQQLLETTYTFSLEQ